MAKHKKDEPRHDPEAAPEKYPEVSANIIPEEDSLEAEAISPEEFEALKRQLGETQAKMQEYLDGWQRALADFSNYKKRVEREGDQMGRLASGTTIKRFLPIIDDLERALSNRPTDNPWTEGIELVYRKFQSILEAEGVTRIDAEGKPFDPTLHEAILQEPSDTHESGSVIAVVQQGYMLGDRVLRPALVKVAQ